jgi:hypothetical protein
LPAPFFMWFALHRLLTLGHYITYMFGTKSSQVFSSRWMALRWSLGVMALAYCSVPSADPDVKTAGSLQQDQQAAQIVKTANDDPTGTQETETLSSLEADYQAKIKAMQQFETQ